MKRKIFVLLSMLLFAGCGSSQFTSEQKDIDLIDANSNTHKVIYLEGDSVKLKHCASGPFNRNCKKTGKEITTSYDKFLSSLSALFGTIPYHPSEQGIKELESLKKNLRTEIATGNLPSHERELAERQLKELGHKKEAIGRVIFFLKQIRQGEFASISSFRREYRLVEAAVKHGHVIPIGKYEDDTVLQVMYLGSGPRWEASQRCKLLGGRPPNESDAFVALVNKTPDPHSYAYKFFDLYEAFQVDLLDEEDKISGQSMGVGYWSGEGTEIWDAKSRKRLLGVKSVDRLGITCVVRAKINQD